MKTLQGLCVALAIIISQFAIPTDARADAVGQGIQHAFFCGDGTFLVGFAGRTGAWIDTFHPVCAPWNLIANTMAARFDGPTFGTPSANTNVAVAGCGQDQAVKALDYGQVNGGDENLQDLDVTCFNVHSDAQTDSFHPQMLSDNAARYIHRHCNDGDLATGIVVTSPPSSNVINYIDLQCANVASIMQRGINVHVSARSAREVGIVTDNASSAPAPYSPRISARDARKVLQAATYPDIEGNWNTNQGTVHFARNGAKLNGTYAGGKIMANQNAASWTGYWSQTQSNTPCGNVEFGTNFWGRMTFTFNSQNSHFDGTYSYCNAPAASGQAWNGDRIP